ncbi:hypothetical protein BGZ83_001067 [Gryganskiella cystojenkinii]|nr:hypothetical protein BGZ83_001067 [Gryganskiella cystojenkinii]
MNNTVTSGIQNISSSGVAVTAAGGHQQQQAQGQSQGQGQASHRNVQFQVSNAQQQLLQQHHQQHQQQDQQTLSGASIIDPTTLTSGLPPKNPSNLHQVPSLQQQQQQQQQHSMVFSQQLSSSSSQVYQQQHSSHQQQQHRPPIAPALQPRLYHSASAGNIAMISNLNRLSGVPPFEVNSVGTGVHMPKKKDPYATAWRTYSKIAEELNLLNPDGTLYPISKEAILKYLHHQSKRIKSSNLHWYVNGLKKHQENLGFPWDDVRYDEQVVGLLKELTLHPVMMTENGDEDGHGGHHIYGSQPNRQRQANTGIIYPGRVSGHLSSSSIDTTQIANLSISQRPHPSLQQQQPFMNHQQQLQHRQQYPQLQQSQQRSQTPYPSKNHNQQHYSQTTSRIPTSTGIEGEEVEDIDLHEDDVRDDDENLDDRRPLGLDDFDDMEEDPNRFQPLKRRASTGTLLSQSRASAVKPLPDPYDNASGSVLYQKPVQHHRHVSSGERRSSSGLPPRYRSSSGNRGHHHHLRSPSPDLLQDEGFGVRGRRDGSVPRIRDSPPESTSSNSSASSHPTHHDDLHQTGFVGHRPAHHYRPSDGDQIQQHRHNHHRHASSSGSSSAFAFSPRSGISEGTGPLLPPSAPVLSSTSKLVGGPSSSTMLPTSSNTSTSKNTVNFSEVAEFAQQLQIKYGTRCKDHPWGCVEIASGQHLELTIKMYLDWAGLVASGRLTMDELPDLPEFRIVHSGNTAHSLGGTLRRMTSTPYIRASQPVPSAKTIAEESGITTSISRASIGPYRSPSSSPPPVPKLVHSVSTESNEVRMPSHQGPLALHDQQQQQSNIRARERQQQLQQRSVRSSPRRITMVELSEDEFDGLSDDEDDDYDLERDRENDESHRYSRRPASNQYALDPWSTLRGGTSSDSTGLPLSSSQSKNEEGQSTKAETTDTTAMDIEQDIVTIGEIAAADTDPGRANKAAEEGSAVDAAAQVLDSMKIGRTMSSSSTMTLTSKDAEDGDLLALSTTGVSDVKRAVASFLTSPVGEETLDRSEIISDIAEEVEPLSLSTAPATTAVSIEDDVVMT